MTAIAIGANLPPDSRIWRGLADTHGPAQVPDCKTRRACQGDRAGSDPQIYIDAAHHFRTPSPDGWPLGFSKVLPVNFFAWRRAGPLRRQAVAQAPDLGRSFARLAAPARRALKPRALGCRSGPGKRGADPCAFQSFLWSPPLALRPVVTPSASRPPSAGPWGRALRPSPAAALSPVPPSAPRATLSIASSTPANAEALTRSASAPFPSATPSARPGAGGVVLSRTQEEEKARPHV